ncbi:MAG: glycosyltransferase [Methyloceanibacter sp.]|uniref:glycosyltransferase n=1 Tax=Methyloceanibacter sp. TaxID=1965321 RepID=UPI003EE3CF8F
MRLLVIGPVEPYRGGIARHTTALSRELASRKGNHVAILSFARQYPRTLYPGQSDRVPTGRQVNAIETDICIDTVNPISWHSAARRALRFRADIAIIPAWTFFVAPALGYIARALNRQGVTVIVVVHNVEDHESARWKLLLSRFQLRQATRFITNNAALALALDREVPDVPAVISPHPLYDDYPMPAELLPRSAEVELLFFGFVRPYKGLEVLIRSIAASSFKDIHLSVVGEFWRGRAEVEALVTELGLESRVEIIPRYVSDTEAATFFERCDAVVAPYQSATASGVLALAQWYEKPVIASDIPGLADAIDNGKTGWLFPAGDVQALAELLSSRVSQAI